jgi:hypothetical protein
MEQLSTEERSDLKRSHKGSAKKSAIAFKGGSALKACSNHHLKCGKGADAIVEADISSVVSTAFGLSVWGIAANK